jgi:hypothetical protein
MRRDSGSLAGHSRFSHVNAVLLIGGGDNFNPSIAHYIVAGKSMFLCQDRWR